MIHSLEGTLASKTPAEAVIEVSGVGYDLNIPVSTFSELPPVGDTTRLLTYLYVREDQLTLYGFASEQERDLFTMLLDVNRVGPSVALGVLSSCSVDDFRRLISDADVSALASMIKGVGKKTAQRLILELEGELADLGAQEEPSLKTSPASGVIKALVRLGEKPATARKIVKEALEKHGPDVDEETLMRDVLAG